MPDDIDTLVCRLAWDAAEASAEVMSRCATDSTPQLLVAAAVHSGRPAAFLPRASRSAVTTRDRQLVAIASAHFEGDDDRLHALVRDHLTDHPDSIVADWIAGQHDQLNSVPPTQRRSR